MGERIRAIGPSCGDMGAYYSLFLLLLYKIWTIAGNKKARVFPEPVWAIPIKSLPLKAMGKANLFKNYDTLWLNGCGTFETSSFNFISDRSWEQCNLIESEHGIRNIRVIRPDEDFILLPEFFDIICILLVDWIILMINLNQILHARTSSWRVHDCHAELLVV